MTLSTAFAPLRALARALVLPAILLAATSLPAAAQKKDLKQADVYVGVFKDDVKPIVVFVFSDSSSPKLNVIDAAAFFANPEYKEGDDKFDPNQGCLMTLDFSLKQVPKGVKYTMGNTPVYGPNSKQSLIDPFSLPSYMAREAVKTLSARSFVLTEEESSRYFNCAGWLWARLLDQPPEFWNEFLKNKIAEKQKELGIKK